MTKHVKRNSKQNKPQKLSVWLGKSVASDPRRPVLTYIHKTDTHTESANGNCLFRTTEDNEYELGLTPTKKSETLRDGTKFPRTDALLPRHFDNISEVHTVDLINALQCAIVFSKDNANFVTIKTSHVFKKQWEITILGKSAERGDCSAGLDSKTDALKYNEYKMNGKYMLDALNGMKDCDTVTLKYDGGMMLIEGGNRQALIMGVR